MSVKIKLRYDTLTNWDSNNPTLLPGEFGVARKADGTVLVKVGNGVNGAAVNWTNAALITSTSGTPIEGLDYTDLQPGEVLFWDGTQWYGRGLDQLINGGNRISVTRNSDGTIDVAYYETIFGITASFPTITTNNGTFTSSIQEVGVSWSGSLNFQNITKTGQSTVALASGSVSASSTKLSGFTTTNLTVSSGTGSANVTGLSTGTFSSWFSPSDTTIVFTINGTSVSDQGGQTFNASTTLSKGYGWNFWGFTSENSLSLSEVDGYVNDLSKNALLGGGILNDPNSKRNVEWNFSVNTVDTDALPSSRYLYFAVSTQSSGGNYGWTPTFYPPDGALADDQFQSLGVIQLTAGNNLYYTIYRGNIHTSGSASFDVD